MMSKFRLAIILAGALVCLGLLATQPTLAADLELNTPGVITVSTEGTFPPFSMRDKNGDPQPSGEFLSYSSKAACTEAGRRARNAPSLWRLPMWHVVFAEPGQLLRSRAARSRDAAIQVACELLAADYDVRPRKSPNRKLVDRSLLLRRQAMS